MATDIVQSLFGVTPDMYQQQQARQADARALQFAQLTPMQQAQYGIGRGAYGLAGALGGALGAQDPELQRISARNSIAQQIDYSNPTSIMQGVNALSQAGDTIGAMQLADVARKMESEMAQTFQRTSAGKASLAQAGRERAPPTTPELTNARAVASRAGVEGSPEYNAAFDAEYNRLTAPKDAKEPTTNELTNARALAAQVGPVGSPEYNTEFRSQLARLTAKAEGREPTTTELTNARAIALQAGPVGSPEYNAAFMAEYNRLTAPKDVREPTTPELTNARAVALRAGPVGSPEYNAALDAEYKRLTAPKADKSPSVGGDREAVALEVYNAQFADLTPEQRAAVNKRVEQQQAARTPKVEVKNVMPGDTKLADIPAFRRSVQQTIAPQLESITATGQALKSIEDSINTNNFVSFNAARTQLAKSLGDSQLSRRDIEQAGGDPSILGGAIDFASRKITSTPSIDTQKKIQATLQAIQTVARKQATTEVEQQRKIALRSPGYNPEAVNEALKFSELQGGTAPSAAPAAAGTPIYARNPTTKERIMSTDGGVTWTQAR